MSNRARVCYDILTALQEALEQGLPTVRIRALVEQTQKTVFGGRIYYPPSHFTLAWLNELVQDKLVTKIDPFTVAITPAGQKFRKWLFRDDYVS